MKIFIGCASSDEIPSYYKEDCKDLIDKLLLDNDLIYGAYNEGLMGMCFNTARNYNRKVTGIGQKVYTEYINNLKCDNTILTDTIIDRTKQLFFECDVILFLPGGIGTINEMMAAIDSKRSNELNKPIIIYNSNHYYDKLIEFLDKLYNEKFTDISVKDCYKLTDNKEELINYIKGIGE